MNKKREKHSKVIIQVSRQEVRIMVRAKEDINSYRSVSINQSLTVSKDDPVLQEIASLMGCEVDDILEAMVNFPRFFRPKETE